MNNIFIQSKDGYRIGHSLIDYDHQTIINITNELFSCVEKGLSPEEISTPIKYLTDYVEKHFEHEESIFLETDYPGHKKHMKMQLEIEQVVHGIAAQYTAEPSAINIDEVLQFLQVWLTKHIMRADRTYMPFIAA